MDLTTKQKIKFFELFSRGSSYATFERVLNLSPNHIKEILDETDIKSPDEARALLRKLKKEEFSTSEANIAMQTEKAREAEKTANQRLAEIQEVTLPPKEYDVNLIKQEDAERQKRFESEQKTIIEPEKKWELLLVGSKSQREDTIQRLRMDIINYGLAFCTKKYNASAHQIRFEAERLGLNVNWDTVRR